MKTLYVGSSKKFLNDGKFTAMQITIEIIGVVGLVVCLYVCTVLMFCM